jgi:hypothetical protein
MNNVPQLGMRKIRVTYYRLLFVMLRRYMRVWMGERVSLGRMDGSAKSVFT